MDGNMSSGHDGHGGKHDLFDLLCDNVDSVVTIYTEACCFTGLLCAVNYKTIKIITKNRECPGCSYFGKLTIIPICQIDAVTFCNSN